MEKGVTDSSHWFLSLYPFPLNRDLKNNEISWTIEDMNGAFSGLDKLTKLWVLLQYFVWFFKKKIKKKISLYYACFKGPVQHDVIFSIAEMIFLPYRFVCYKIFLSINRTFRLQVKLIWNIHSNFKCCTIYRNILERMRVSYNIGSDKCIIKYYRGIVTGIVFNKVMQHPIEKVSVQKRYNLHMRVYK